MSRGFNPLDAFVGAGIATMSMGVSGARPAPSRLAR